MNNDWIAANGWVRPAYDGRGFSSMPGTITSLLTGEAVTQPLIPSLLKGLAKRYERVVLVLYDGFGLQYVRSHAQHPLIKRARAEGLYAAITSQFPSTTAAHLTTIHTGLPVGTHGIYEWQIYEPSIDSLIVPLPFVLAGSRQPITAIAATEVYPRHTLYEWLAQRNIRSVVAKPASYIQSATNQVLLRGVEDTDRFGYYDISQGFTDVAAALAATDRTYGFIYVDALDGLLHQVGTRNQRRTRVWDEIEYVLSEIERALVERLPSGTLVLVVADHGHSQVSPRRSTYLNECCPDIEQQLQVGADGRALAPAGSCRDLFLYIKAGHLDTAIEAVRDGVGAVAEVRSQREMLKAGLFGAQPSQRLLDRLGDIVVLPMAGHAVYWHTPGRFTQRLWSQHGGLTRQEMKIPVFGVHATGT